MCTALPRLAHGRSRLCHPGPPCCRLRAAALTAESGRVVRSSGPYGPLHRRPWLRHRSHRRGHASAASRPRKAHARVVTKVCLSAQRSADRSVQPRSHGHCAAGLPPPCAGLPGDVLAPHRLGNALEQTLRLASSIRPPGGSIRKAPAPLHSARAIDSCHPATPSRGLCGSLTAPGDTRWTWPHDRGSSADSVLRGQTIIHRVYCRDTRNFSSWYEVSPIVC
jgi:hypothetical protein